MDKIGIFALIFLLSSSLSAFQLKGKLSNLDIKMPSDFKLHTDFLGLPYVFIKNEKSSRKSSMSVIPTGIPKIDLDSNLLNENYDQYKAGREGWAKKRKFKIEKFANFQTFSNSYFDQYKAGREGWAKKRKFKIEKFANFQTFSNSSRVKVISGGYFYEDSNSIKNVEKSYYILCPREAFQLKLLTEVTTNTQKLLELIEENIKNSTCQ